MNKGFLFSSSNIIMWLSTLLMCAGVYVALFLLLTLALWLQIVLAILAGLMLIGFILLNIFEKAAWYKTIVVIFVIGVVVLYGYYGLVELGFTEIIASADKLSEYIESMGVWGYIVFAVIQFLQVVAIPIPAMITTAAGTLLFGPLATAFISLGAIVLGSVVAFYIGRLFGDKVVSWIIGKEKTEKYSKLLYEKGKYVFFLMMLFPIFPDDILCMVAGMTAMRFGFFFGTIVFTRIISVFCSVYATDFFSLALQGGGPLPFHGWGLVAWISMAVLLVAAFVISIKFQKQIEAFVSKLATKMGIKKTNKTDIVPAEQVVQDKVVTVEPLGNAEDIPKDNVETKNPKTDKNAPE